MGDPVETIMLRVSTPTTTVSVNGDRSYVVGRGREADIVVPGNQVSRRHVALEPDGRGWTARDLSANGIWHDGRRVPAVSLVPVEASRVADATPTVIRLGALDGPRLSLVATWPPGRVVARAPAEPDISAEETLIAPSGGQPARPAKPAKPAKPAEPGKPAGERRPRRNRRWLRTVPTLLWLMAAGFTIGALVALS
jgi:FHA domain